MHKSNVVLLMKEYATNKRIKDLLMRINPLLTKKEKNIHIHLEALKNSVITEDEFRTIEAKMELGKLCLGLEKIIPNSFVTLSFMWRKKTKSIMGLHQIFLCNSLTFSKI